MDNLFKNVRSEITYEVEVEKDIKVKMRDDINLSTDIYYPTIDGKIDKTPRPVLLHRTPYDKGSDRFAEEAEYFTKRGYIVVIQDNRGRYNSEGEFHKYTQDANDGYDLTEWIVDQEWCNGKIGTYGTSYGAHTQAAMASMNAKGLQAMIIDCGGFSNAYMSSARHNGAFELRQLGWAISQAKLSKEAIENPVVAKYLDEVNQEDWLLRLPWKKGHSPLKWTPAYEDYILEEWSRGEYDDYWKQPGLAGELFYDEWSDIPQIHTGGWYDSYTRTTFENYIGLSKKKKAPVRVLMGPWTHGQRSVSYAGEVDFGLTASINSLAENWDDYRLLWFDAWMKDFDNGFQDQNSLLLFIMGGGSGLKNEQERMQHGGQWRFENEWPLARTKFTPYYFLKDGSLSTHKPLNNDDSSTFKFDPDNPIPTIGGGLSGGIIAQAGAFHQIENPQFFGSKEPYLPLESRPDILVYETEVLTEDLEVTGPVTIHLEISSSAKDTDFTAKLIDVCPPNQDYPDGFHMNLTDSIMRARYRNSWEKEELMTPGEVYSLDFELYPTGNLFKSGHKIRVDISSSNFPRFDVNPNTGGPLGVDQSKIIALNTIHQSKEHASYIMLPIIPQ